MSVLQKLGYFDAAGDTKLFSRECIAEERDWISLSGPKITLGHYSPYAGVRIAGNNQVRVMSQGVDIPDTEQLMTGFFSRKLAEISGQPGIALRYSIRSDHQVFRSMFYQVIGFSQVGKIME